MRLQLVASALLFLAATMAVDSSPPKNYSSKATELDLSLYPVAPEGLTLEQVNVFVRHGEDPSLC